jgi:hypothetical protein
MLLSPKHPLSSFRDGAKRGARNPYSVALGLWIPGSLAALAPRNDAECGEMPCDS